MLVYLIFVIKEICFSSSVFRIFQYRNPKSHNGILLSLPISVL